MHEEWHPMADHAYLRVLAQEVMPVLALLRGRSLEETRMAEDFATTVAVIGAGVVGLAVAERLSADGHEVLVLERNGAFGRETSSRNSEVIHAGLQYPPGSLKARLCVEGNQMLYEICARAGIPHQRLGKLVIAVEDQEEVGLHGCRRTRSATACRVSASAGAASSRAWSQSCERLRRCTCLRRASLTRTA